MIEREIVITVPGHPKPKGSMVCRRDPLHQLREMVDNTHWRAQVTAAAKKVRQHAEKGQHVGIEVTFTLARPVAHYGTGRNDGVLKDWARRERPTGAGSGDVDKLARLVLDALQSAGVLHNDAQVAELMARKAYVEAGSTDSLEYAGALIRIYPIEDST